MQAAVWGRDRAEITVHACDAAGLAGTGVGSVKTVER